MDCVVAPVDHAFPVVEDEVKITEPPEQKVVGPPAVIVGVAGSGFTVTAVAAEVAEQLFPFVTVTVYDPLAETVIDCVVAPVDQAFPVVEDEVKTTLFPAQKVVGPPAVMVGVVGSGFTVTVVAADVEEHPFPSVNVTV